MAAAHRRAGIATVTAQRLRRLEAAEPDTITSRMGLIRALATGGDITSAIAVPNSAVRDAELAHGSDHWLTHAVLDCGKIGGLIHRGA